MSKVSLTHTLLRLVYNGAAIGEIADNPELLPLEDLWVSLHTQEPKDFEQSSGEVQYEGYSRTSVPRSEIGWSVVGDAVFPVANIDFPVVPQDSEGVVTHFSVGTSKDGTGWILDQGPVEPTIPLKRNVLPRLNTKTSISTVAVQSTPNTSSNLIN